MDFCNFRKKIIAVVGHYGSGKTNFAVNLALNLKANGKRVTLIDLDTVNPYFRAADAKEKLSAEGIGTIIPEFANTNVDLPSLPPEINRVFDTVKDLSRPDEFFIFDVGGSDGAVALGMYNKQILAAGGCEMIGVINMYRPLTDTPESAVADLREIEDYSRLKVTSLVNNSSIGVETTSETVLASVKYAETTAELMGVPLLSTSYIESPRVSLPDDDRFFKMKNATKQIF